MLSHVERVLDGDYLWPSQLTRHVAIQVAYEADRHGVCRASQGEIAAAVGTSRRSVARALVQLEGDGLLIREGHGRYVLCPEWRGIQPQRRERRQPAELPGRQPAELPGRQPAELGADPDR